MSNNSPKSIALRPSSSVKPVKEKYTFQPILICKKKNKLHCFGNSPFSDIRPHNCSISRMQLSLYLTIDIRLNISSACFRCDCDCEDLLARASDFDPGGGFPYPAPCFCSSFFKAASCFLTTTVKLSSSPTTSFFLPAAAKRTLPALTAPGFISHVRAEAHWAAWRLGTYITCGSRIVSTFLHCVISIHSSSHINNTQGSRQ